MPVDCGNVAIVPLVTTFIFPPEEEIETLDVPLAIEVGAGTVPLTILTLVNVKLPIVEIVFPRATEALPMVTGVVQFH